MDRLRDELLRERERSREWHELVNRVSLLTQTVTFMQAQQAEQREQLASAIKARDTAIENLRQKDLQKLADAIDEKVDRSTFVEFREDQFKPIKNKTEANSQFQTKAMVLISALGLLVPAIVSGLIKHFMP